MKPYPYRQEYLISYDIEDNKIRNKVYRELGKHGLKPVQKSVFWGYVSMAEMEAITRYLNSALGDSDKAFATRTTFNGRGHSYTIGHQAQDFSDWEETCVI